MRSIIPKTVLASTECMHSGKLRKASNVLNDDELEYWYSDKVLPQTLKFTFDKDESFNQIGITFQGGFAGDEVQVYLGSNDGKFTPLGDVFYLDDVNSEQILDIGQVTTNSIMLEFNCAYDMYSRIIVYSVRFRECLLVCAIHSYYQ